MELDKIVPYGKNAKKHPAKQLKAIADSIKAFGWRQPIVVDKDGVIIVGHGRWFAYSKYKDDMGLPEPKIEVAGDLTPEEVNAYRLADNKLNESDWVKEMVAEELQILPDTLASLTGFDLDELITKEKVEGEVKFTTEVLEANNYIVFVFDNVMDWQVIMDRFNLETKQSLDSKEGYVREGVGRVVDGRKLLRELKND